MPIVLNHVHRSRRLAAARWMAGLGLMLLSACGGGETGTTSHAPNALSAVRVDPATTTLVAGATATLTPTPTTAGAGVSVAYSYASSAAAVATVSQAGVVTAVSAGSATITVSATGSGTRFTTSTRQASAMVTVTAPPLVLGMGFAAAQFTLISAGSFQMGDSDPTNLSVTPVHTVTISSAFTMQKTEVTQAQWRQVMQGTGLENPSAFVGCGDTCPVERVSWDDIQTFLQRLNSQDPGKGYRLPTEAEWEYAARAGTTGEYGGNGVLSDMGWWNGNAGGTTHRAVQKMANAWGLFDMHGNAGEWVNDWFAFYSAGPAVDPTGPGTGSVRVIRGGSWGNPAGGTRSAIRGNSPPSTRVNYIGFRLARNP